MKILRFTMDSPDALQKGWALKKKTPNKIRNCLGNKVTAAVRRQSKPTSKEKVEPFPAETLKRLKAQVVSRALERRFFSSGRTYLTILPDRTGYCKYVTIKPLIMQLQMAGRGLLIMICHGTNSTLFVTVNLEIFISNPSCNGIAASSSPCCV